MMTYVRWEEALLIRHRRQAVHCRPQTSLDEDLFSRLVQLDGLRTRARLREERLYHGGRDPHRWRPPVQSRYIVDTIDYDG